VIIVWVTEMQYMGAIRPLILAWPSAGPAAIAPVATARGDIDFDQIRVTARTGDGSQLITWNVLGPGTHTAPGTPGQIAYDASYFYWCYAPNLWARNGPGGYSNSF
jgi:hypothetical protein